MTSNDSRLLSLKAAATHIGQTRRWMFRHWPELAQNGVKIYRLPKWAPKGRLVVDKISLETYLNQCLLGSPNAKQ